MAKKHHTKISFGPSHLLVVLLVLLFGTIMFIFGQFYFKSQLAPGAQLEAAHQDIVKNYLMPEALLCTNPINSDQAQTQTELFLQYLRVNKYANRAVIRGCNNTDHLLMKDKSGHWIKTNVNVALDKKADPKWQKACLIEDITVADTVKHAENDTIDALNLAECRYMLKHGTDITLK